MYREPRQSKVIYVKVNHDNDNNIIKIDTDKDELYLNDKTDLTLSFNSDNLGDLRIFIDNKNPLTYEEYEKLLYKNILDIDKDTGITLTNGNYEISKNIKIFKI